MFDTRLDAKLLKLKLLKFFKDTPKTGWGKVEIQNKIQELYIEFLEEATAGGEAK